MAQVLEGDLGQTFDLPAPPREVGWQGEGGVLPALILSPSGEKGMHLLGSACHPWEAQQAAPCTLFRLLGFSYQKILRSDAHTT